MVHEMIGITNNRVDLKGYKKDAKPDNPDGEKKQPELTEIVLSPDQDPFYQKNMFLNFGELGASLQEFVDGYRMKAKSNENIETIEDMKNFVANYPQFKKLANNVSKHVNLMEILSKIADIVSFTHTRTRAHAHTRTRAHAHTRTCSAC